MALTDEQKADIRYYLGWPERFHQTDSRLEQAMSAVAAQPEGEALLIAGIASCQDIDTKLVDAHGRLKALKVGSINLPGGQEIEKLRDEGRRFAGRMANTLGVEVRYDVFGGSGPKVATHGGSYGGGHYGLHG